MRILLVDDELQIADFIARGLSENGFTSGVATVGRGIAAAIAILRHHERGALVLIPLITGLLLVVFVTGEAVSPH